METSSTRRMAESWGNFRRSFSTMGVNSLCYLSLGSQGVLSWPRILVCASASHPVTCPGSLPLSMHSYFEKDSFAIQYKGSGSNSSSSRSASSCKTFGGPWQHYFGPPTGLAASAPHIVVLGGSHIVEGCLSAGKGPRSSRSPPLINGCLARFRSVLASFRLGIVSHRIVSCGTDRHKSSGRLGGTGSIAHHPCRLVENDGTRGLDRQCVIRPPREQVSVCHPRHSSLPCLTFDSERPNPSIHRRNGWRSIAPSKGREREADHSSIAAILKENSILS